MTDNSRHEEMKRYLFQESADAERAAVEEHLAENNDYFYELLDLENNLVDRYARGDLKGDELTRFERSLKALPERREKVANARAIRAFIAEEKPLPLPTLREQLSAFFSFQMPVLRYAGAALLVLLTASTAFLIYRNAQTQQELTRLRGEREAENAAREKSLQEQIAQSRQRESELQREVENRRGEAETFGEQLDRERAEKKRLENELENLRREGNRQSPEMPGKINPPIPTIASVFLVPTIRSRGGSAGEAQVISISRNAKNVNFSLRVPQESAAETYGILLNGASISANLKPRSTKSGIRILNLTLPAARLGENENTLTIVGNDGKEDTYSFRLQKQ